MSSDLADHVDGTPGRFVPREMKGELIEAEHFTRYWWTAELARGRRVLDAGCGMAYGAALMAEQGAGAVTGVDLAEDVVAAASADVPDGVQLEVADLRELPFADGSFDLAVCFEVIEHVDEQARVLDELKRVLAPGGLLAISSPNRDAYVPGNPHHRHELTAGELEAVLSERWSSVRVFRQNNYVASTIVDGDRPEVRRLADEGLAPRTYTVALAGDGPIPEPAGVVTLAAPLEIRQWVERFAEQQELLQRQADALERARHEAEGRRELQRALAEAETGLAEVPSLRRRLEAVQEAHREVAEQLERAELVIADMQASASWQITAPLRRAKHLRGRSG